MIFLSITLKTFALGFSGTLPWHALGLWLAGAACDLWDVRRKGAAGWMAAVREVALWNAAALVIGWVVAAGCDHAAMRWKDGVPVFASAGARLLGLFGYEAGAAGGTVLMSSMAGPLEFAASIDAMALNIPLLFLSLFFTAQLWLGVPVAAAIRRAGAAFCVLAALAVAHFASVVMLADFVFGFTGYESEELPWRPFMDAGARMLLHLPLLAAAAPLLSRLSRRVDPTASVVAWPRRWWLAPPAALLASLAVCWQPAGRIKDGDIVIADWHTQWSPSARPYDREWYGADSGYNYACLKRLFGIFRPVRLTAGPLSTADLKGAAVLVIYVPDRAFNPDQITMIRDFVREGGGLLLIGDHTNVFGSTSHLNTVCDAFGFQFRDDVLFDLDDDFHQMIEPPRPAPSAWNGIGFFKLRGPASIRSTSLWTRPVWQVGHSKAVRAIYSVNNFYPPPHDDPKMTFGRFCVAATAGYGRGRVAAWGDSTVFSNFEIFNPGKYEYLLNTMHWLGHRDSAPATMLRRMSLALLIIGTAVLLAAFRSPRHWFAILAMAGAALAAGNLLARIAEQGRASFPEPAEASDWVVFLAGRDDPTYNLTGFVNEEPYEMRYEVFIQWVLRTGAMSGFEVGDAPRANGLYRHLEKAEQARVARALIVRSPGELARVNDLADGGGPMLLMAASELTGKEVADALKRASLLQTDADSQAVEAAWPSGEAVIEANGRRLMVVAGAERFSDRAMGVSEKVVPDAATRERFNQAFAIIDRLLDKPPAPQAPDGGKTPTSGESQ